MNPIALACTAALGLLLFGLGLAVSALRFRHQRVWGSEPDPTNGLTKVIRAHGNTAEYAPLLAVLFVIAGTRSPSTLVLGLIVAATVCRVLLVVGLIAGASMARPNPARFVGALGTYVAGAGLCIALLVGA